MQRLPLFVILCIAAGLCAWNIGRHAPDALGVATGKNERAVRAPMRNLLDAAATNQTLPLEGAAAAAAAYEQSLEAAQATQSENGLAEPALDEEGVSASSDAAPESMLEEFVREDDTPEGTVKVVGHLLNGLLHGPYTEYSLEGDKLAQGEYIDGARAGRWIFWRSGGVLRAQGDYSLGRKDGQWLSWHDDGTPERMAHYQSGEPDGQYVEWYSNGGIRSQGQFVGGLRQGLWTFLDYYGAIDPRTGYYENGKRLR